MFKRLHDWWTRPSWKDFERLKEELIEETERADMLESTLDCCMSYNFELIAKLGKTQEDKDKKENRDES